MRYAAERDDHNSVGEELWIVVDNTQDGTEIGGSRWFTPAEAKVIEFALNAVAEGRTLQRSAKPGDTTDADIIYMGPTDL